MHLVAIICGKFLDELRNFKLLKKVGDLWNYFVVWLVSKLVSY
jgi:hypothetical protein